MYCITLTKIGFTYTKRSRVFVINTLAKYVVKTLEMDIDYTMQ